MEGNRIQAQGLKGDDRLSIVPNQQRAMDVQLNFQLVAQG